MGLLGSREFASATVVCSYRGARVRVDGPSLGRLASHIRAGRVVVTNDPDERAGPTAYYHFDLNLLYLPQSVSLDDPAGRALLLHEAVHALQDEQRWPRTSRDDAWMSELHAHIVEVAYLVRNGVSIRKEPLFQAVYEFVGSHRGSTLNVSQTELETLASRVTQIAGPGRASDMQGYAAHAMTGMGAKLQQRARIYDANPAAYRPGIVQPHVPTCSRRR